MTPLAGDVFASLSNCVENRIGLCVRAGDSEAFRKTLLARMQSVKIFAPEEYLHLLEADTSKNHQEWQALAILLTTGESYFFRDKGHFFLLRNTILPELLKNRQNHRSLRIWSAGCATGEEPYSVAILLDGLLPDRRDWHISIIGTDINAAALEKARRGMYTQWSFRMVEPELKLRYFKRRKEEWEIDERIRNAVTFRCGNLIEELFPSPELSNMDLILCRNVFIYFNRAAIAAVAGKFINTLNEGGYLVTGHGELHLHEYPGLRTKIFPESVVYQKRAEGGVPKAELPPEMPKIAVKIEQAKITEKAQAKVKVEVPSRKSEMDQAQGYADRGEYKKAEESCKRALAAEPHSAKCYYLLSQLSEAQGRVDEAAELLKKVIYLDHSFVAAYLEMGNSYARQGDSARARKMRETALGLLDRLPKGALVAPYEDITAGELLEYVQKMLK